MEDLGLYNIMEEFSSQRLISLETVISSEHGKDKIVVC